MERRCIGCNTIIPDGKNVCPMCGATIPVKYDPIPEPEQQPPPTQELKQNNKTKKCSTCGMDIPMMAKICPYCRKKFGLTLPAKIGLGFVIIFVVSGIMATINKTDPPATKSEVNPEKNNKDKYTQAIAGVMIMKKVVPDPGRLKINSAILTTKSDVCYEFSFLNASGGLSAMKAILPTNGDRLIIPLDDEFEKNWNSRCMGKTGENIAVYLESAL